MASDRCTGNPLVHLQLSRPMPTSLLVCVLPVDRICPDPDSFPSFQSSEGHSNGHQDPHCFLSGTILGLQEEYLASSSWKIQATSRMLHASSIALPTSSLSSISATFGCICNNMISLKCVTADQEDSTQGKECTRQTVPNFDTA